MINNIKLPLLTDGNTNIFLIKDSNEISQNKMTSYFQKLSEEEKQKFTQFHFEKDKRLYLLSRVLLKSSIAHYLDCHPRDVRFGTTPFGKPFLLNNSKIHFNLTHSSSVAAVAINSQEDTNIGIDIESPLSHKNIIELANNCFSLNECQLLNTTDKNLQQYVFFQLWTLKESYIKAIGKGLSIDLERFSFNIDGKKITIKHLDKNEEKKFWCFLQLQVYQEHLLSLAIRANTPFSENYNINIYEFFPEQYCEPIETKEMARSCLE